MSAAAKRVSDDRRAVDSLGKYFMEIGAYPLLTRDEEAALSERIRAGDSEAVRALVCANLRFVVAIAKKYRHQGVALSDLVNEGNVGLIRAAERYDHTRGVKFISYAIWWVRQAIVQAISENAHSVRVPMHRVGMMHRVSRRANALRQALGREPTREELAAELELDAGDIEVSLPVVREAQSLNAPMVTDGDLSLGEVLADADAPDADGETIENGLADTVREALGTLRPREAMVLRLYFGFDGDDGLTLEEIGARMGITRERVRQIKERALVRLRRSPAAAALASFAGE